LFAFYIRIINNIPDKILSFDPVFMYRQTYYLVNWGHLPVWDEISYYTGKIMDYHYAAPLMFYLTALLYSLLKNFGFSLLTTVSYAGGIYGAAIAIPAFLLGRELSNKYGGLLAAVLVSTAPQILVRTFGASYDTDQIVLFFILFTLFSGVYALRKKTISSFCLLLGSFIGFMLSWPLFSYTLTIIFGFVLIYFLSNITGKRFIKYEKIKTSLIKIKDLIKILIGLVIGLIVVGILTKSDPIGSLSSLLLIVQRAEVWIVNISIAELQPFSIFNIDGWMLAMGRFSIGDNLIDILILIIFSLLMFFGFFRTYKEKNLFKFSFLLTLFLVGVYSTFRGIRFTEFTTALFIIIISAGFGYFVEWSSKREQFLKSFSLGLGLVLALFAISLGLQLGQNVGPDISPNWDNAWSFLKTQTPEFSLVGTWWDPGHMINGYAERRNIADGAHCANTCMYTINDRIVDLGKIMATSNENESLELIRKYQGDSPKVYWIASDDLIGKFQWLQYFGTGCDARTDNRCPLYMMLGEQSRSVDNSGNIVLRSYGNVIVLMGEVPIPIFVQDINAALFEETIYYANGEVKIFKPTQNETQSLLETLKPLERQLNIRFVNQTMPLTVWVPQHFSYIVIIPQNLRNSVFTKMFMLEGQGLEYFKQVFRNEEVKIYEVI